MCCSAAGEWVMTAHTPIIGAAELAAFAGSPSASPTLADVAKIAGVSTMTVSRVVNGGSVSEATRRKVLTVVRRLGYRPDQAARALAERRARG
jgi:LacI family transcriptional regulator